MSVTLTRDSRAQQLRVQKDTSIVLMDRVGVGAFEIHLDEGASLTHYQLFLQGSPVKVESNVRVTQSRGSQYTSHAFLLGQGHVVNNIDVRLDGEQASCTLNGLYVVKGQQRVENHTRIDHLKPHGTSRELYKGILSDQSQAVFDGLIVVQPGAQKTDSVQTNRNLLLSKEAKANTNPELKIFANDVKCKHGATIGQLQPESLFYLRSRGIPEEAARQLLVSAFASEMINLIDVPTLRDELFAALASPHDCASMAHDGATLRAERPEHHV